MIYRFLPLKGKSSFDVKKTNSLVSPYFLVITFDADLWHNGKGSSADYRVSRASDFYLGFTTKEKALAHMKPSDFTYHIGLADLTLFYAFQKNCWVYKAAHGWGTDLEIVEDNAYLKLLTIPFK
jgi:hypothetical protein